MRAEDNVRRFGAVFFSLSEKVVRSFCCFMPLPDGKPDHGGEWTIRQDSEVFGCVFVCTVTLRKLVTCWKKSLLGRTCSRALLCIAFLPRTRLRVTHIYTDTSTHTLDWAARTYCGNFFFLVQPTVHQRTGPNLLRSAAGSFIIFSLHVFMALRWSVNVNLQFNCTLLLIFIY